MVTSRIIRLLSMMKAFDPISHSINHHASQPRLNARESVCLIFYDFVSTIPTVAMTTLYEHMFYLSWIQLTFFHAIPIYFFVKKVYIFVDIINEMIYYRINKLQRRKKLRIDEQLKILGIKTDMTLADIARNLGKSPQAFSQKMHRGNFTLDDLDDIAMATKCKLECSFLLPNGERIVLKGE